MVKLIEYLWFEIFINDTAKFHNVQAILLCQKFCKKWWNWKKKWNEINNIEWVLPKKWSAGLLLPLPLPIKHESLKEKWQLWAGNTRGSQAAIVDDYCRRAGGCLPSISDSTLPFFLKECFRETTFQNQHTRGKDLAKDYEK